MPAQVEAARRPSVESAVAQTRPLMQRGEPARALGLLAELEAQYPRSGLLWQERGACQRALGDAAAALSAYQRAVDLNDALADSWQALKELYSTAGQHTQAAEAARYLARLAGLPAPLVRGASLLNEGELEQAEEVVRDFLRRHGAHVEGMRLLAQIAVRREVLDDAEFLLENVLERAPEHHEARYEYAAVLTQRRRYLPALLQARRLLQVSPAQREWRLLYAKACDGLGENDEALRVYGQLAAETPGDVSLQLSIAHLLRTSGSSAQAIATFRHAAAMPGGAGGAFFALANMKTYRFGDAELARMRAAEAASDATLAERYYLCFALGKAREDRQEYAASFGYYERGNALKRSEINYNPELNESHLRLQAQVCTHEFFAARRGSGCQRADPIFIVGLPRSGSTLIEQILASHSQVDGTQELAELPRLLQQFRKRRADEAPRYPAVLAELTPQQLRALGEAYLDEARVYRRGAPFFIDKMPGNFRDAGFIHLILPNAKIIDARRAAMACCFGNFKQLFVGGQEFTYNLEEMGHYYRSYVELMDHWQRVLPGKVLRVDHEDVVNDLERSVRRLLEFCGLKFEPACVEFYKTERSVRTVSSEQVRRPINREGLHQWRNYAPWLEPLKRALGPLAQEAPQHQDAAPA